MLRIVSLKLVTGEELIGQIPIESPEDMGSTEIQLSQRIPEEVTGEEEVEEYDDQNLLLKDPMKVVEYFDPSENVHHINIVRWVVSSVDEYMPIPKSTIATIVNPTTKMARYYQDSLIPIYKIREDDLRQITPEDELRNQQIKELMEMDDKNPQ